MLDAGYNASILAYGQTGSGKSHSIFGSEADPGLLPRLCSLLWDRCDAKRAQGGTAEISISMLEIYNEEIFDLLVPRASRPSLHLRDDGQEVGAESKEGLRIAR